MPREATRRRRTAGGSRKMVHQDCGQQLFEQAVDLIEQEKERSLKAGADPQEVGAAMLTMVANLASAVIRHFCEDPADALAAFAKGILRSLENRPQRPASLH